MQIIAIISCAWIVVGCSKAEFHDNKESSRVESSAESSDQISKETTDLVEETFSPQKKYTQLDILLVIDDSSSMRDEQAKLQDNLPHLLVAISNSDWQIAVIGTSYSRCVQEKIITKDTPNYQSEYAQVVNIGAVWGNEFHVNATIRGLQNRCEGETRQPWLRSESDIAILIVTDQCNECPTSPTVCRVDGTLPAGEPCLFSELQAYLDELRPQGNARIYGIVDYDGHWYQGRFYQGWDLQDLNDLDYLDLHGSIEADNYDTIIEKISQDISSTLTNRFQLKSIPEKGSLSVMINGEIISDSQIQVEDQTVVFDQGISLKAGDKIVVKYKPAST